ncbi:MAG: zf-HC2 domain-containing protein [Rhodothermia bacterium]|nr:zf-HC2 domain-containing protein [Rhodothermia bacterium]
MLLQRLKAIFGMVPTCEKVNNFIASYLEGALDDKTTRQFEAHIRACTTCSQYLDQYRATVDLVHEAGSFDPPPELVEMTLAFLQKRWEADDTQSENS